MSASDQPTGSFGGPADDRPSGSPSGLPVEQQRLLDEACDAFEGKWKGRGRPDILAALLELREDIRPVAVRELVALDVFYRRKAGEAPAAADYAGRFPDLDPDWLAGVLADARPDARTRSGSGTGAVDPPSGAGVRVGDFELLGELGRGGMGVVYRARQAGLNRDVALKMLLAGPYAAPALRARFLVEAESVAALEHPHVVRVFAFGEHAGHAYLAMEYLPGGTLADRVKASGPLPGRAAAELVAKLASAVAHAHSRGVVHRDIKPGNVLFGSDGEPRLADFGLAKVGRSDLSVTGQVLGTPAYMAPEQAAGKVREVGTAADVYALGAVLYDLLTGRPPFLGDSHAVTLQKVLTEEPERPRSVVPSVPRDLETVCLKCLEKDPARRYPTAQALADELGRYLRGEPIEARPAGRLERAAKWVRRNPAVAALAGVSALLVLAAVGGAVAFAYSRTLEDKNRDLEAARSDADTRRTEAEGERKVADEQRKRATEQEALAHRYLYVSRMTLAQQAERENNPARVVQLLRSVIPENPDQEDVRGFEWYHLWRKHHGEESLIHAHTGPATGVAFSPDGLLLASSGADGTVRLWDSRGGKERHRMTGHTGRVAGVAFAADGKLLVSGGQDGTIRVWDVSSGRELKSFAHGAPITAVVVSPDGKTVACGTGPEVVLYGIGTGKREIGWSQTDPVARLAFGPDGQTVVSVSAKPQARNAGGEVVLWDRATQKRRFSLPGNHGRTGAAFSPDGSRVAACDILGNKFTVTVHDAASGTVVFALNGHENFPTEVTFDPVGKYIATGGLDRTVRVWDANTGQALHTLHDETAINGLAFSADGGRLAWATDDGTMKVWSPPAKAERALKANKLITSVVFSPDGRRLAVSCINPGRVFDAVSGKELAVLAGGFGYGRLAWSPDSTQLGPAEQFGLWDSATGKVTHPHAWVGGSGSNSPVGAGTAFSRDGRYFATVTGRRSVHVWDRTDGRVAYHYQTPGGGSFTSWAWPVTIAFHPDGRQLAIGTGTDFWSFPGTLQVVDVPTGRVVRTYAGFRDSVTSVAFSHDGLLLAAAISEVRVTQRRLPGEIRVWDTETGQEVCHLQGHSDRVYSIAFSPDGRRLVSGGHRRSSDKAEYPGDVRVWDLVTRQEVFSRPLRERDADAVAFSPCGRFIALGGMTGVVTILDGTPPAQTPAYRPLPD